MKYVGSAIVAAVLSVATLSHAEKATDLERWLKKLDNYAVVVGTPKDSSIIDAFEHARAACICTEDSSLNRRPGYVTVGHGVDGLLAICAIPTFDASGALDGAVGCQQYSPLAK